MPVLKIRLETYRMPLVQTDMGVEINCSSPVYIMLYNSLNVIFPF